MVHDKKISFNFVQEAWACIKKMQKRKNEHFQMRVYPCGWGVKKHYHITRMTKFDYYKAGIIFKENL